MTSLGGRRGLMTGRKSLWRWPTRSAATGAGPVTHYAMHTYTDAPLRMHALWVVSSLAAAAAGPRKKLKTLRGGCCGRAKPWAAHVTDMVAEDNAVRACMRAGGWAGGHRREHKHAHARTPGRVCLCARARVRMCACVCMRARVRVCTHSYTRMHRPTFSARRRRHARRPSRCAHPPGPD